MRTMMLNSPEAAVAWERYQDILGGAAATRRAGIPPVRRPWRATAGEQLVRLGQMLAGTAATMTTVTPRPAGAKLGGEG